MNRVNIRPDVDPNNCNCFIVELITTNNGWDVYVAKYQYYNFIGNGDMLSRIIGEWLNNGISPESQNGLIKL